MEVVLAAAVSALPPLIAIWHRTNGRGPLAKKLDCIERKLDEHIREHRGLEV